jgi:iron complex transport system substrate-binding protein
VISKGSYSAVLILIIAVLLGSCRYRDAPVQPAGSQTRQVTDDLGRSMQLPVRIERAVSLAPNLTEEVFAVGAGDRLVGVTTFCDFPAGAKAIAKVGDTMSPNMETIVALKPDVVFVSTASQIETFTGILNANGIAVYVTDPNSIEAVLRSLRVMGDLFGTGQTAENLATSLEKRISTVKETVGDRPTTATFVQISREPLFTIGRASFMTSLLALAGARSVTADVETAYPKLSKETAAALDPDVIILSESPDNTSPNEVFGSSTAMRNGRVYKINADIISRPGPRLVDALEQLARYLHPGAF